MPSEYDIYVPENALKIIDLLQDAGYNPWLVGGFVRAALMKLPYTDIDIASDASWQEVKRICEGAGMAVHETGTKHGTVTVVCDGYAFEVTTFRTDGKYIDARHPESVAFVKSITEDLARRDFTMNAIAYRPDEGILDPFDGVKDIENKVIRTVGDPSKRLSEDALRILRACRFASQLGFEIKPSSYEAMLTHKHLLRRISIERITHELDSFVTGTYIHDALLKCVDVLEFILPELTAMKGCKQVNPHHIYDVLEHTAYVMQNTPPYRLIRWAALCHDMGKPASAFFDKEGVEHFYGHADVSVRIATGMLKRLLMSNAFINDVLLLVRDHDKTNLEATHKSVRKALNRFDGRIDLFEALCDLKTADALSQAKTSKPRVTEIQKVRDILKDVLAQTEAFQVSDLAIDGNDLIALGVQPGPFIGDILNSLLDDVIEERIANSREDLTNAALQKINQLR